MLERHRIRNGASGGNEYLMLTLNQSHNRGWKESEIFTKKKTFTVRRDGEVGKGVNVGCGVPRTGKGGGGWYRLKVSS